MKHNNNNKNCCDNKKNCCDKETNWEATKQFFNQSADKITKELKDAYESLPEALDQVNSYLAKAGKNISESSKATLEDVKKGLKKLYEK